MKKALEVLSEAIKVASDYEKKITAKYKSLNAKVIEPQSRIEKFKDEIHEIEERDYYIDSLDGVREAVKEYDRQSVIARGRYKERITALTKGIEEFANGTYNVKVCVTDEINAYAWPDGSIRVNSGLMDILEDDELIAIIGHEMGHLHNKDAIHTWKLIDKINAAKDLINGTGNITGRAIDHIEDFINAQYSQKQEYNADEYGMEIAMLYGYDPYAAARALDKFVALDTGDNPGLIEKMMRDHPESKKRAERIRLIISEYGSLIDYFRENEDSKEPVDNCDELERERFESFLQSYLDDEYSNMPVQYLAKMFENEGTECNDPVTMSMFFCVAAVVRLDCFIKEWWNNGFENHTGRIAQSDFQHECLIGGIKDIRAARAILPEDREYQAVFMVISILKDFWIDERNSNEYYQANYGFYLNNTPDDSSAIFNPEWIHSIFTQCYDWINHI